MNFRIREKTDFQVGELVVYIPPHADDDPKHPDCEYGIVSSVNDKFVFIKVYRTKYRIRTIEEAKQFTAHGCKRENLIRDTGYHEKRNSLNKVC